MNYEEKYNETIEKIKGLLDNGRKQGHVIIRIEDVENALPEVKESDDELVRKTICNCVKWFGYDSIHFKHVSQKECLAWLEKQGEQKPVEYAKGEDYDIDDLWAALDILRRTYGKVQGYQSDNGIFEHQCAITALKKLYEKKLSE